MWPSQCLAKFLEGVYAELVALYFAFKLDCFSAEGREASFDCPVIEIVLNASQLNEVSLNDWSGFMFRENV